MKAPDPFWEVVGFPLTGGTLLVLRRFRNEQAAIDHALKADMSKWDDVWVRPGKHKPPAPEPMAPPPFPWSVARNAAGTYIVDATGKKIATLLGVKSQREQVARIICRMSTVAEGRKTPKPAATSHAPQETEPTA